MIKLTDKEKRVFYALVRWPEQNDIQLSERLGIKRPTVTAIRNKLERGRMYETINLPLFDKLGCEIFLARYGNFNPLTPYEMRKKFISKFREIFFRMSTDTTRLSLGASQNYTEIKKYIDYSIRVYGDQGFIADEEDIIHTYFPYRLSKIHSFYNFAPLLNKYLQLNEKEGVVVDTTLKKPVIEKLTVREKEILYELVTSPHKKDDTIARKLDVTRQTVNSTKNKLRSRGIIRTVRIPNLKKLGFELLVFSHSRFKPNMPLSTRGEGVKTALQQNTPILFVSGNLEDVMISAYEDYSAFQRAYDQTFGFYKQKDMIRKNPTLKIVPLKDIKSIVFNNFEPLMTKLLKDE